MESVFVESKGRIEFYGPMATREQSKYLIRNFTPTELENFQFSREKHGWELAVLPLLRNSRCP